MSMLDGAMSALGGMDLSALAAKVGLTPEKVQMVMGALAKFQGQPGDTAQQAAAETGVDQSKVQQLIEQVGGEGALGKLSGMMGGGAGGLGGMLGKL